MYITVHTSVGLLIGQAVSNWPTAFILGMASHFALDIIPHGDVPTDPEIFNKIKAGKLYIKDLPKQYKKFI